MKKYFWRTVEISLPYCLSQKNVLTFGQYLYKENYQIDSFQENKHLHKCSVRAL